MNRAERLAKIDGYAATVGAAEKAEQVPSLVTAEALAEEFTSGEWATEMVVPERKDGKPGRPVDPKSRAHFAKWVDQRNGLVSSSVYRLFRANELVSVVAMATTIPEGSTEASLRPLNALRKDFPDLIPVVWAKAVADAGGNAPTSEQVKAAKAATLPKQRGSAARETRTMRDDMRSGIVNLKFALSRAAKDPAKHAALIEATRIEVADLFEKAARGEDVYR